MHCELDFTFLCQFAHAVYPTYMTYCFPFFDRSSNMENEKEKRETYRYRLCVTIAIELLLAIAMKVC